MSNSQSNDCIGCAVVDEDVTKFHEVANTCAFKAFLRRHKEEFAVKGIRRYVVKTVPLPREDVEVPPA